MGQPRGQKAAHIAAKKQRDKGGPRDEDTLLQVPSPGATPITPCLWQHIQLPISMEGLLLG